MPRSVFSPYEAARELGRADAEELLTFANLTLTPVVWTRLVRGHGVLYEPADDADELAPVATLTELWDAAWCARPAAYKAAQRLQREVRAVLVALLNGERAPVERLLNSAGSFRCRIEQPPSSASTVPRGGRRGRRQAGDAGAGWRLSWVAARPEGLRAGAVHALRELLPYASRLGRCERCERFFIRDARWAGRPRRFCGEGCSVAFHNERRLRDGSFARWRKQRRKRRAKGATPR